MVEVTEDFIRDRAVVERYADGSVSYVYRTRPRHLSNFLAENKRKLADSQTKRFGDGQIVASIPLNVLFDPATQLAEKLREGDRDHLKWFLDRDEAKPWRTFRGRLT